MPRGVDQIELIDLPVARLVLQRRSLGLDRDAALALEVHRVEDLRLHLTVGQAAAALDQAVGQRRLAVVDVGNDGEVSNVLHTPRAGQIVPDKNVKRRQSRLCTGAPGAINR